MSSGGEGGEGGGGECGEIWTVVPPCGMGGGISDGDDSGARDVAGEEVGEAGDLSSAMGDGGDS